MCMSPKSWEEVICISYPKMLIKSYFWNMAGLSISYFLFLDLAMENEHEFIGHNLENK
jgi:hypothetical protein